MQQLAAVQLLIRIYYAGRGLDSKSTMEYTNVFGRDLNRLCVESFRDNKAMMP